MEESKPAIVRFGVFEANLRGLELRKNGFRIKLQELPFRILILLLERRGELVTREELRQKLWPEGTFVDFEHGLNTAIMKLRAALDDSADNPRFIETVARRGYRFIAPVTDGSGQALTATAPAASSLTDAEAAAQVAPRAGVRGRVRLLLFTGLGLAMLLAVLTGLNVGDWHGRLWPKPGPPAIRAIAVLPLQNLSGDPAQEYFSDGMTDALITDLAKIGSLRVIARTSVMHYKSTTKTAAQIARELGVDAVVEGSVVRAGDKVRVTAQLIEAARDQHLWAESYERDLRDIIAVQDEVSQAIARQIHAKLTPQEQMRPGRARPVQPEAYEAYLKGRYFWNKRTEEGLRKSVEYYQQAVQKDPGVALAYAGLAETYCTGTLFDYFPAKEALPAAKLAAVKALEIDDTLAEAHTALARVRGGYEWDWVGADKEYQRALELNPNLAWPHDAYAQFLARQGRHAQAQAEIRRAQELDPLSPLMYTHAGNVFYYARQYDQAISQMRRALELDPNFAFAHRRLWLAYERKGQYQEAVAEHLRALALEGQRESEIAGLRNSFATAGIRGYWTKVLDSYKQHYKEGGGSAYRIATFYARLGDKSQAFQWLGRAFEERAIHLVELKENPVFDDLRSDPRFADLLRRLNFPL